jgi:hypothetical protein
LAKKTANAFRDFDCVIASHAGRLTADELTGFVQAVAMPEAD